MVHFWGTDRNCCRSEEGETGAQTAAAGGIWSTGRLRKFSYSWLLAQPSSLRNCVSQLDHGLTFIFLATASATLGGSARSSSVGLPVWIAQNVHARVQILPRIIKVAVPRDQHSPILGHWALWQTVWSWLSSTRFLTLPYSGPEGSFARSQLGLPDLE